MGYPQPPGYPPPPATPPTAGQPYGAPPVYGAPTAQYGYGTPPPVNRGGSPTKLILIVVVALAVLGGGALLVTQLTKKDGKPAATSLATPSTIETPKPTIDNRTTTSLPSTTGSGATTTRASSTTGATTATTATGATATTTRPSSTTRGGGGSALSIGGNVQVVPASGWQARTQNADLVVLTKQGALFHAETVQANGNPSADAVTSAVLNQLGQTIQNVQSTGVESIPPPKSNVVSAAGVGFAGSLAGQQGSIQVEGAAFSFVRQDGLVVIVYFLNAQGQTDTYKTEYGQMLGSILASI